MSEVTGIVAVLFERFAGKGFAPLFSVTIEAPLGTNAFGIKQKFEADHSKFIGIISLDAVDQKKLRIFCLIDGVDLVDEACEALLATINFLRTNPLTDKYPEEG
ncbi:MAG: hypothetical protein WC242_04045 [Candidatus Paceibacterota bacterium]|jgi:hypothetical protein